MERKTKVYAENDRQELTIIRDFDLPVHVLFKAYTDAELLAQWMGTKVLKLDHCHHGGYAFETSDAAGRVVFKANGTIHDIVPDKKIVRTFEMENAPFDVQLEFLEFEALSADTSRLNMHVIYRSVALRDAQLKMPFAYGINMAHDRLQEIVATLR